MAGRSVSALSLVAVAVLASASTIAMTTHIASPPTSIVRTADDRPLPDSGAPSAPELVPNAAALTPTEREYQYVPIKPCRIVDTRKAGGKIAAGAQRAFVVKGTTGFAAQGGTSNGCGIPAGAAAATFSFTTTEATGKGRLNAWPDGQTEPGSTVLSYTNANKVTSNPSVALRLTGTPHLRLRNYDYATHLVVDVTGYYVGALSARVTYSGQLVAGSRVINTELMDTGKYRVEFDTNLTGCVAVASADYLYNYTATAAVSAQYAYVTTFNAAGVAASEYFNLLVLC